MNLRHACIPVLLFYSYLKSALQSRGFGWSLTPAPTTTTGTPATVFCWRNVWLVLGWLVKWTKIGPSLTCAEPQVNLLARLKEPRKTLPNVFVPCGLLLLRLSVASGSLMTGRPPDTKSRRYCSGPNTATLCFRTLGFFWNHRFCGSNPIENVVCRFVQAAGRVNMGVKVLVWV